jgi:ferrous iron transport protein B
MLQRIGEAIEPVTRIFGLSWQSFMAFIASMISKEGVLGVFSAIYTGEGSIIEMATKVTSADANITEIMAASFGESMVSETHSISAKIGSLQSSWA